MFTFELDEESIFSPETEEKYDQLEEKAQEEFLTIFSKKVLRRIAAVGDIADEDEEIISNMIEEAALETINQLSPEPKKADNWRNGLDLL